MDEDELARRIVDAHAAGALLSAPAGHGLDAAAAYRVQAAVVGARRTGRRVGWKLGYTSEAMRRQMGVDRPNLGPLHDEMLLGDSAVLAGGVTQPRVEPEVAAVIGTAVRRPDDLSAAVTGWHAALEVVDSVWAEYRFDWALNTADGSSAAFVVLGEQVAPGAARTVRELPVRLHLDGEQVADGTAAAAMGDPWEALRWLVAALAESGDHLRPGDVVITGGLTHAVPLAPGATVRAEIGPASVSVRRA